MENLERELLSVDDPKVRLVLSRISAEVRKLYTLCSTPEEIVEHKKAIIRYVKAYDAKIGKIG